MLSVVWLLTSILFSVLFARLQLFPSRILKHVNQSLPSVYGIGAPAAKAQNSRHNTTNVRNMCEINGFDQQSGMRYLAGHLIWSSLCTTDCWCCFVERIQFPIRSLQVQTSVSAAVPAWRRYASMR